MCVCVCTKRVCKVYRTEGVYCRYIQYIRILVFVQSRIDLFIVNCLLKNILSIHFSQQYTAKFSCKYNFIKVYNKLLVIQA